jgi:hypothetical protein
MNQEKRLNKRTLIIPQRNGMSWSAKNVPFVMEKERLLYLILNVHFAMEQENIQRLQKVT